jgi:hypothetical protein
MIRAILLATALLLPSAAHAATVSASQPDSVVKALAAAGHKAELVRDDFGDPQVNAEIAGWKAIVLFYDCGETHDKCRSLQFRASFDAPLGMMPDAALAFMRSNRFASVVLDQSKDPRLQWDLVTGEGIDSAVFDEAVNGFGSALAAMGKVVFPERAN